jgi:hypothetical protein
MPLRVGQFEWALGKEIEIIDIDPNGGGSIIHGIPFLVMGEWKQFGEVTVGVYFLT